MKKFLLLFLLLTLSRSGFAFSMDNADFTLLCPQRGQMRVILHRYDHTQVSWGPDHFETGGGHTRKGSLVIFEFANLDQMIYDQASGNVAFWYADQARLVHCQVLNIRNTWPVDIPYYRGQA